MRGKKYRVNYEYECYLDLSNVTSIKVKKVEYGYALVVNDLEIDSISHDIHQIYELESYGELGKLIYEYGAIIDNSQIEII